MYLLPEGSKRDCAFRFCFTADVAHSRPEYDHIRADSINSTGDERLPAALACRLSAVGLFSVATGEGQPTPCMAASLLCWGLGVPGQDRDGSWSPAEVGVRVEEEDEMGEEERVMSPASLRGCSCRMDS